MDPYAEWAVVGRELLSRDPYATLWDLIKVMYTYKTGCTVPEMPEEDDVVDCHYFGYTTEAIAAELESDKETVSIILKSAGFCPFTKPLPATLKAIVDFPEIYPVSTHIGKKVALELAKVDTYYERDPNTGLRRDVRAGN